MRKFLPVMAALGLLGIYALAFLISCTKPATPVAPTPTPTATPQASPSPSPAPTSTPVASTACVVPLAWESSAHPERAAWSNYLCGQIAYQFTSFNKAQDASRICPNYSNLAVSQQVTVWAEFMVADAKYESAWTPTDRYLEATLGKDSVTGQPVESEGLWQLSYDDQQWATWCQFDWPKDKLLSPTDPNKTILNPSINTQCAMGIMARQITNKGKAILTSGVYWSTLEDGGKYSEVPGILAIVKAGLPFCAMEAMKVEKKLTHRAHPKNKKGI